MSILKCVICDKIEEAWVASSDNEWTEIDIRIFTKNSKGEYRVLDTKRICNKCFFAAAGKEWIKKYFPEYFKLKEE